MSDNTQPAFTPQLSGWGVTNNQHELIDYQTSSITDEVFLESFS